MLVLPAACGTGDQAAFDAGSTTSVSASDTTQTTSTTLDSTAADTAPRALFPAGAELIVSFTYEPSSAQSERPYVAVWVEDSDGNLVDTISLWFDQGNKGTKWLSDLSQWYQVSGGDDTTMSGATKVAGEYTVTWDGTDADGNSVAAGDYVLNIESAREDGPTSFTSSAITVDDQGFTIDFESDGELSGVNAALAV